MKIPKINFSKQFRHLERLITDNSPVILTAIGVVGVAGTAVLTHKAALKSVVCLSDAKIERGTLPNGEFVTPEPFTKAEQFSIVWKFYVAPVAAGTLTCASIIGAQKINARRAAAIAGALALTQDNFKEYKDKVTEKLTGPQKRKVDEELAQEKADRVFNASEPIIIGGGELMCVELWTGRVFASSREKIERAVNDMNKRIIDHDAACLAEFYDMLKLDHTDQADKFGWNTAGMMEVDFKAVFDPSGKPALGIVYESEPVYRPWEARSHDPR